MASSRWLSASEQLLLNRRFDSEEENENTIKVYIPALMNVMTSSAHLRSHPLIILLNTKTVVKEILEI